MESQEIENYERAGKIAKQITDYAKEIIKPNVPLIEIAQKIHKKIIELGAKPAFPVNLSINDIAAQYHPALNDETKASGLIKIDIGIHINGFIADTAFTIDLTPDNKYKELIQASEKALENGKAERAVIDLSLAAMGYATIDEMDKANELIEKANRIIEKTTWPWLGILLDFSKALAENRLEDADDTLRDFTEEETIQQVMTACLNIAVERHRSKRKK